MASRSRYTAQQVIDALKATRGMVYLAAKALQCDPETVMNYCKRFPTVEQAKHDARGELLDIAEVKLWTAVQAGEHWAITFALKTLGRSRGYVEKVDLSVQIDIAVQKVAASLGLDAQSLLLEAQQLLREMDADAL